MAIKPLGFPYFQELCALRPELCGFPYYQTLDRVIVGVIDAEGVQTGTVDGDTVKIVDEGEIAGNKYWIQDGDKCDEKQQ